MKNTIKLIAFDLDETLLNTDKSLSSQNEHALLRAEKAGIFIVPATGRVLAGIPESVRALPLRYAIVANGAQVVETDTGKCLYQAVIANDRAVTLMHYLDTLPVAYDCYMEGRGYMAQNFLDAIEQYIITPTYLPLIRGLRRPVPYLPDHIKEAGLPLQKVQVFMADLALKARLMPVLTEMFPDLIITTSTPENIEITTREANKGAALRFLCAHLGLPLSETMAFGDGLNDLSMITAAGLGIAMANAMDEIRAAADYITLTNNESGVAAAIEKFCF